MLGKRGGIYIEIILLYEKYSRPDAWYDEDDDKSCGQSLCSFADSLILIFGRAEPEYLTPAYVASMMNVQLMTNIYANLLISFCRLAKNLAA
jgi:hypothetical protein